MATDKEEKVESDRINKLLLQELPGGGFLLRTLKEIEKRVEALEAFRGSRDNLALIAASLAKAKAKYEEESIRFNSAVIANGEIIRRYREREMMEEG